MTYNIIMVSKKYASHTIGSISAGVLHQLLERGKNVFTLDEALPIYGHGRQETSDFLGDLVKRGVLARIKSGIFLILQIGQEETQLSNWPLILPHLMGKNHYYVSHYSAMRLHGMTTHQVLNINITLTKRLAAKKVHRINYLFIYSKPINFWGHTELWVTKQEKIWVSDLERTVLDGLERPSLCGGLKEVIRGIWSKQNQIDWKKLARYAKKYPTKAAVKRLGCILDILNLGKNCTPLLEAMIATKNDYIFLDPDGLKTGSYLSRWRVRININIDEIKASIWG